MKWFRWYHGTAAHVKMGSVARRADVPRERVIAVWVLVLESASTSNERGQFAADADGIADCLNCDTESIERILSGMEHKGMIRGGAVLNWDEYQSPNDVSTERVRKHREKRKTGDGNVSGTVSTRTGTGETLPETDRDVDRDTTPSIYPSARAKPETDDERISLVIRLSNRGMSDNPLIDKNRLEPILPAHGDSRQAIADWRAEGIEWSTIEATVYDKAVKYKPKPPRHIQIGTMKYFTSAVRDAHELAAALTIEAPTAAPSENQFRHLAGDPELLQWAEQMDGRLRADELAMKEGEKIKANLRRLNHDELKSMKPADQEAFLWIRVLKWYGERVGVPRPGDRRAA